MDPEQLEALKEQMKLITASLVQGVVSELKEELRAEQKSSSAAMETEMTGAIAKLSKKMDELEKTLSATSFANRVFDDSFPPACTSSPTVTVTATTTTIASTTITLPTSTNVSMACSTLVTAPNLYPASLSSNANAGYSNTSYFPTSQSLYYPPQPEFSYYRQPICTPAQQLGVSVHQNSIPNLLQGPYFGQPAMSNPVISTSSMPPGSSITNQASIGTGHQVTCALAQPAPSLLNQPTSSSSGLSQLPSIGNAQSALPNPAVGSTLPQPPTFMPQPGLHLGQHPSNVSAFFPGRSGLGNFACSLAPFDGTVSWPDYRIQFEIVARNNNWSPQEKADAMATQLRGSALSVLSVFPRGHRIQYEELVGLLEQRFGVDSYASQVQFCGRTQGAKESAANFALELQRLATTAFPSCPTDVVDRMAVLRFLEGLRDDELRTLVKVRGPKTLHEAVNAAQELSLAIGTGRNARVYLAQPPPSNRDHGRRRRRQENNRSPLSRVPQGLPGPSTNSPANSSLLYGSFVPAQNSILAPTSLADSGNPSTSSLRGMSR